MRDSGLQSGTLEHVVVPPRVRTETPPMLLLLHGRGSNEQDLLSLAQALDPRLLVVSARAPMPFPGGSGYHWYDIAGLGYPEPTAFADSLDRLHRFIPEMIEQHGADPARVFSLGFSQGAVMTGGVLLTRPDLLAGAIILSGYLPLKSELTVDQAGLRDKPVFVAHGTYDPVIGVDFGHEAREYLTGAGAALAYHEYAMDHRIDPQELAEISAWLTQQRGPSSAS